MDFSQLQYFNTVASFENMSKAAEVLHISQPSLSKYIAKLEEEVGHPLFDRNGKKITLNKAGQEFLQYSLDALELLDNGIKKINSDAIGMTNNKIRVGIIGDCSRILGCISAFLKKNPDCTFDIQEYIGTKEAPSMNDYDVLICPDTNTYSIIDGIPFYSNREYLAVSSAHKYANNVAIKSNDLDGLDMVFIKQDDCYEASFWSIQVLAIKPNRLYFVNSRALQKQIIEENIACGFVFEDIANQYTDSKNIRLIPITDKRFSISMKICFKREKHLSDYGKVFKNFALEYYKLSETV